jgi:ParB family chromosome partitioning protein
MKYRHEPKVQMIPIDQITVVNARGRGKAKFKQIVANISHIGLKKPVTVARRRGAEGQSRYDLVCGQGRLEAFIALGQTEVPAIVVEATKDELFLMSLAENCARRQRTTSELAREILCMHERGQKLSEIARKVDLDVVWVKGIIRLIQQGETQLLIAVEHRTIPMATAVKIAESADHEVQRAMAEAYERGDLRGRALIAARRIVERRHRQAKTGRTRRAKDEPITAQSLLKAYRKESSRQKLLVGRAKTVETKLRLVVTAMKKLLNDDSFVNLLRAESLSTLPQYLADQIKGRVKSNGA